MILAPTRSTSERTTKAPTATPARVLVPVSVTLRDPDHDGTLPVRFIYVTVHVEKRTTIVDTLFEARLLARRLGLTALGTALVNSWEA